MFCFSVGSIIATVGVDIELVHGISVTRLSVSRPANSLSTATVDAWLPVTETSLFTFDVSSYCS